MSEQTSFVRIEDALIRTVDVSHMKWDRGHSFTKLLITMRDGKVYAVSDHRGSAYDAERRILAGVAADELRSAAGRLVAGDGEPDEAAVDRGAEAMWLTDSNWDSRETWASLPEYGRDLWRDRARGCLLAANKNAGSS